MTFATFVTHVINIDVSYRFRDNIAIADDRQREATGCRKQAEDNTLFIIIRSVCMKSLKIPKGQSESVNRRTDNTMTNRTNNDLQNIANIIKDRVTRTPLKTGGELSFSGRVDSSCSTSGTRRVTVVTNPVLY